MYEHPRSVKLVVFDWAGTTVDHGCFAPVAPFIEVFREEGVDLSVDRAREPMGLHKRDHIRALLEIPAVAAEWKAVHAQPANEADVQRLFKRFMPRQLESVKRHSSLVPGLIDTLVELRRRGLRIGTTTGYFQEAAELVYEVARRQGYVPDENVCATEVPVARPAPWMIFRLMERLEVFPPAAVVKVGDTVPDIGEGRNAGVWTVGVAASSSDVGLTAEQLAALPAGDRHACISAARQRLLAAGAHWVIDTVADLPALLDQIESRLAAGERP